MQDKESDVTELRDHALFFGIKKKKNINIFHTWRPCYMHGLNIENEKQFFISRIYYRARSTYDKQCTNLIVFTICLSYISKIMLHLSGPIDNNGKVVAISNH